MGEMVMKNRSDKGGSVFSGLDPRCRKQAVAVMLAVCLFFVLCAFTFMNFLYCLSDCIGSIVCGSADIALRDALRSMPIFLSFLMTLSGLMTAHTFYRNEDPRVLLRRAVKHAMAGLTLGVVILVYVICGLVTGRYEALTEGAPSALYPLDSMLYSLPYIALGIATVVYFSKTPKELLYQGPCRAPIPKRCRLLRCFFRTIWLLIGLYGFCGFFYSFFIVDFTQGYLPYIAAVMLVSLVSFLTVAVWELYYNNLTEQRRRAVTLKLALISLAVSCASAVFYFIALGKNLDGPSNVGFGILPVAYSSGFNFATLLVVATPLIVSLTALIKGISRRSKKNTA